MVKLVRINELMKWTFKSDFSEPFVEIVLFLFVGIGASRGFLEATAVSDMFAILTWNLIYPIIFLVAIGGARSFALSQEHGEIGRQLIMQGQRRIVFLAEKFLCLYLLSAALLIIADGVVFLEYLGYFFSPLVYPNLLTDPVIAWSATILEQLMLLFFLDSLILFLGVTIRKTTVVLLVFLAVTILGVSLYVTSPPSWAADLQLGYGDYNMTNLLNQFLYADFYRVSKPTIAVGGAIFFGLIYRFAGGVLFLVLSFLRFMKMDLD